MKASKKLLALSVIAASLPGLNGCGPLDARNLSSRDGAFVADIAEHKSGAPFPNNRAYSIKVRTALPTVWVDKLVAYNKYGMGCDPDLDHLNKASASTDYVPYEMETFQPLLLNQQTQLEIVFWCRGKLMDVKIWANDGQKKWQSDIRPE
jgi:hypothetical protein